MGTKSKFLGLILSAAVLSLPLMAYADNDQGKDMHKTGQWNHGPQPHLPSIAKVLNLSDDQVKQLEAIHEKDKAAMKAHFEQVRDNRNAFDAQIVLAQVDMNKINDIQTQLKTLQAQSLDDHLNSLLEIKKILTPEQFTGFMALKREREMMMHHGPKGDFSHLECQKHEGDKADKDAKGVVAQITEDQE